MSSRREFRSGIGRGQRGAIVLETMVALSLFLIILSGVYMMMVANQSTYMAGRAKADVQQDARNALTTIVREIALAGYDPQNQIPTTGESALNVVSSSTLRFLGDVDNDNTLEKIQYSLSGGEIQRTVWRWGGAWTLLGTKVLAENVTALTFASITSTRVRVSITAQESAGVRGTKDYTIVSDILLRNL